MSKLLVGALILLFCNAQGGEVFKFSKKKIQIGSQSLWAEIADTDDLRARGLMYRKSLKDTEAMLFIFEESQPQSFWMKNTLIPLSIGFFDDSGVLIEVLDMEPASPMEIRPKSYNSTKPAKYALEVSKGWFKRNKISPPAKLIIK